MIETALEKIPGRAIVNSVNLEAGRDKLDRVLPTPVAHGAALIALTIDEVGMGKTRGASSRSPGASTASYAKRRAWTRSC